MSDEGKEASAPRLGFHPAQARKYRVERLVRPSQWSPGIRVASADEYERFTEQFARELLATCTPDHLAVIAAQHMMYADELKCVLEEKKAEQVAIVEVAEKLTAEIATKVSMIALTAHRTHLSNKRADAVKEGKKDVIAHARVIAAEAWSKDAGQKIRIGEMAKMVFGELKETEHCKLVISIGAVRKWIGPVAPSYASKPGR